MERPSKRRIPRVTLVPRIYLAGVALVTLSALAAWGAAHFVWQKWSAPREFGHFTRFVAATIASDADPHAAIERARTQLEADVTYFDADGHVIANAGPTPAAPRGLAPDEMREREGGGFELVVGHGRSVVVVYHRRPRSRLPLFAGILGALFVIGLAALLGSRWLARPLRRLADTARSIGSGDLGSRTGIASDDEIGDAAIAFDRMAERVEHLLRSQRELLASVSHELRTPLTRIRVALDLASEAAEPGPVRTELAGLEQDIGELELLVSDLLATARLDGPSSAMPLRRESTSLAEVVERARARFGERHPAHVVTLQIEERRDAELDPRLLRRAVENVLDNAHKYSDPDAAIRIEVLTEGERMMVAVRDEGIGIAPEDLAHVFSPFFRADRTEVRASSGLGLGLALARRIVEAHGGVIALESELGQGTTVKITV